MREKPNPRDLLNTFDDLSDDIRRGGEALGMESSRPFQHSLLVSPPRKALDNVPALSISGAIHGNEVQGLIAINEVLGEMRGRLNEVSRPVLFFVGNPKALLLGTRDGQRNMNRSFGKVGDLGSFETIRAKFIERAIAGVPFVLDIHTMNAPSVKPFAITPNRPDHHRFVANLGTDIRDIILMEVLSPDEGLCLDEYAYLNGTPANPVVGITIEVGHVDDYEEAVERAKRAIYGSMNYAGVLKAETQSAADITLWEEYATVPRKNDRGEIINEIIDGLVNFQEVRAGQVLGRSLESGAIIRATYDGIIFFPKYADKSAPALLRMARKKSS